MRTIFFSCLIALGIATAIWFQYDSNEPPARERAPRTDAAQSLPKNALAESRTRPASSKAGMALRSTSILATATKQPHTTAITDVSEKTPNGDTPRMHAPAQEQTPIQHKSAAELFTGFVEDDPSLVFPPATVHYHSALQSEPTDPEWGPATAAALRNYIASQYGERFEIPLVECRRDLCELQVAGRTGGDSTADMDELQRMMRHMKQSPLWSSLQLDQETSLISTSPDGRALWLSFMSRQ